MKKYIKDLLEAILGDLPINIDFNNKSRNTVLAKIGKEQIKLDKLALQDFINNFHWGSDLSDINARNNLELGLVEITDEDGYHSSNGLLITNNGYFVTNYHCVDDLDDVDKYIRTVDGRVCKILKVCGGNPHNDIALVKADMSGPAEALCYKFAETHNISKDFPVALFTRRDVYGSPKDNLKIKYGTIRKPQLRTYKSNSPGGDVKNQVEISMITSAGDSGGVIATKEGKIYGLLTGGGANQKHVSACTFWFEALKIIQIVVSGKKKP